MEADATKPGTVLYRQCMGSQVKVVSTALVRMLLLDSPSLLHSLHSFSRSSAPSV